MMNRDTPATVLLAALMLVLAGTALPWPSVGADHQTPVDEARDGCTREDLRHPLEVTEIVFHGEDGEPFTHGERILVEVTVENQVSRLCDDLSGETLVDDLNARIAYPAADEEIVVPFPSSCEPLSAGETCVVDGQITIDHGRADEQIVTVTVEDRQDGELEQRVQDDEVMPVACN